MSDPDKRAFPLRLDLLQDTKGKKDKPTEKSQKRTSKKLSERLNELGGQDHSPSSRAFSDASVPIEIHEKSKVSRKSWTSKDHKSLLSPKSKTSRSKKQVEDYDDTESNGEISRAALKLEVQCGLNTLFDNLLRETENREVLNGLTKVLNVLLDFMNTDAEDRWYNLNFFSDFMNAFAEGRVPKNPLQLMEEFVKYENTIKEKDAIIKDLNERLSKQTLGQHKILPGSSLETILSRSISASQKGSQMNSAPSFPRNTLAKISETPPSPFYSPSPGKSPHSNFTVITANNAPSPPMTAPPPSMTSPSLPSITSPSPPSTVPSPPTAPSFPSIVLPVKPPVNVPDPPPTYPDSIGERNLSYSYLNNSTKRSDGSKSLEAFLQRVKTENEKNELKKKVKELHFEKEQLEKMVEMNSDQIVDNNKLSKKKIRKSHLQQLYNRQWEEEKIAHEQLKIEFEILQKKVTEMEEKKGLPSNFDAEILEAQDKLQQLRDIKLEIEKQKIKLENERTFIENEASELEEKAAALAKEKKQLDEQAEELAKRRGELELEAEILEEIRHDLVVEREQIETQAQAIFTNIALLQEAKSAIVSGRVEDFIEILTNLSDVDMILNSDSSRYTLLHWAVIYNQTEMVKALLDKKAKLLSTTEGLTPLDIAKRAVERGDKFKIPIVEILENALVKQ
eukprot:TRINITY_DN21711_c0_g2_i1.p1 TRINITY_DN21711_c0_g2~~TRINITY_DN21711_c0_g2_i1.p1  ORF type:complete len:754 (-),score=264.26 TRINITY_DN21711_c0_g2_i1:35-2068(-)